MIAVKRGLFYSIGNEKKGLNDCFSYSINIPITRLELAMPAFATSGNEIDVYRFRTYSGSTDQFVLSRRYATLRAIEEIARGEVLYGSKISIDRRNIEMPHTDIEGMTSIGFKPYSPGDFPRTIQD
jgi:hypothetical protein